MSINDCFERISRRTCRYCGINRFFVTEAHNLIRSGSSSDYHFTHSERYKESFEIVKNYQKGVYDEYLPFGKSHKYCFQKNNTSKSVHDDSKEIYNKELPNRNEDIIISLLQKISWLRESNDNSFDLLKRKINDRENEIEKLTKIHNKDLIDNQKLINDLNNISNTNQTYTQKIKKLEHELENKTEELNKSFQDINIITSELRELKEKLVKKDNLNKNLVNLLYVVPVHIYKLSMFALYKILPLLISGVANLSEDIIAMTDELRELKEKLVKKDNLNKRLVNLLTVYKYQEFNDVKKYDYLEIKQKNKALNTEFKRVAKLMKLC